MNNAKLYCLLAMTLIMFTATAQKGWIQLFNGKDLNDWVIKIKDHPLNENYGNTFRVENGVLKVSYDQYNNEFKEQFGHIYYNKAFSDYLLVVEYRFTGEQIKDGPGWAIRNSGAMLHCQDPKTIATDQDFPISLEMQFLGGNGKDERSTCNLCTPGTNVILNGKFFTPHCVTSVSHTYHGDQWVKVSALVLGDSVIKHIVGKDTVITYEKPQYDGKDKWVQQAGFKDGDLVGGGFIALQSESHPVEFRMVKLFDLSPYVNDADKLNKILKELQQRKDY
ncbi:DUF1080 domain-containing protein [Panacibacter sp. DH6]|uniref:DUF1080 domain-containing protein n=1 Tax=Panacibacter microcysteis TaxID=2793269 RepID=A0A931GZK2_9BACT|nr:DUF1080 domain-containing protein [Panacibacter microcysteis]MBG9378269.1 DUF1080 domain-containing protein [Panacibacter microcysteis]